MVLKLVVYWCPNKCHLLLRHDLYAHTQINYKIRRVWWKIKVFVQNQVINFRFKMIRLYNTVIVLDIVITNW
jgi:hypothetical protein